MLVGSEEKIMCPTSARFNVIILIAWIITDTKRSSEWLCYLSKYPEEDKK